jgi:hypothetical protein
VTRRAHSGEPPLRGAHRSGRIEAAGALVLGLTLLLGACGNELGECNDDAARQLVYSSSGLVATKGQALMHDSCGQGAFCHSAAATGSARQGAPLRLDFDVLPNPKSLSKIIDMRGGIWDQIDKGLMPPEGYAVGDSQWSFDVERRPGTARLAPLSSDEGKGVLRNWLACGAPSVTDSRVPSWATPSTDTDAVSSSQQAWHERRWTRLHGQLRAGCVSAACHDGAQAADAGASGELSALNFDAGECAVYRWLLFRRDRCGKRLVMGGDPAQSALLHKLEDEAPACGERMPPEGPVNAGLVALVRDWIAQGAWAPQCGEWSESAPRVEGLDAGAGEASGPPSWSELHASVIAPKCALAGCHVPASAGISGDLELSNACGAWNALKRAGECGARLVPGDPAASSLYDKVSSSTPRCKLPMPPTGKLPQRDIEAIRAWIEAGASAEGCGP